MADTPQKIVFLLPALSAGGAERVLITLMNKINPAKFSRHFISFQKGGALQGLIEDDVKIHDIGHHAKIYFGIFALLKKLRTLKPDVVVTTMAHTNFILILLKPFLPKGTRIIVREAITPSYMFKMKPIAGRLVKWGYRYLYPQANLVISPSQRIIDEFVDLVDTDIQNHALLYNPVNTEITKAKPLMPFSGAPKIHFVCAGRLHYQKGFDRLIRHAKNFNPAVDWQISILGEGEERAALEKLIGENNLQDKIILHGFTDCPWQIIGAADCFLLPSRFEGLPNVALESLSVGTPVIATAESGGIQEIADLCAPQCVQVVDTMEDFFTAMGKITPQTKQDYATPLLPDDFEMGHVVQRFEGMLVKNQS